MGMNILIILVVAWLWSDTISANTGNVICYHGSWSTYRTGNGKFTVTDIDPSLCTHVIYAFVGLKSDGVINILDPALDVDSENFVKFSNLKRQRESLKTLVAVGGWNEGSIVYSNVSASPTLRKVFINSALELVQKYGFDGFDIDWEYPAQRGGVAADVANYVELIKEFREVFDKHGLLLTAAVAAASTSVDISYDVPALSKYLDFINVMTYDLHGSWDGVTGQNAPLYASSIDTTASSRLLNVDACIRGWIERGADPQKLVLGLGMYGRTYTLTNPSETGLGAPASKGGNGGPYTQEAGMLGYNEICEKQLAGGWTTVWDDEQKVPYTYKEDQWVGYDNPRSLAIKVNFAKSLNLGGVMIWSIETDDFLGVCGNKYPLLNAINSALGTANENAIQDDEEKNTGKENTPVADVGSATTESTVNDGGNDTSGAPICTSTGYVRDAKNCNKFYYCLRVGTSFIPVVQQCSNNLYFDEVAQTCNWPELVAGC